MIIFFALFGTALLVYYALIAVFAGHVFGVALLWLAAGIVLIIISIILALGKKYRRLSPPLWMKVFVITSIILAACLFIYTSTCIIRKMRMDEWSTEPEFIIVPGAQVHGYTVSETLAGRLDAAADYWRIHPDVRIIVSGGNGSAGQPAEAQVMRDYLFESGVPLENIIPESVSSNTDQNMRNSLSIISSVDPAAGSVIIVTSDYHLLRAMTVAEGMTDMQLYGYCVETPGWELPYYLSYETLALFKSWINGYI